MTDKPGQAATSVAVIGTGIMGSAMARNLLAAGLRPTAWGRAPQAGAGAAGGRGGGGGGGAGGGGGRRGGDHDAADGGGGAVGDVRRRGRAAAARRRGVGSDGHDRRRADHRPGGPARPPAGGR